MQGNDTEVNFIVMCQKNTYLSPIGIQFFLKIHNVFKLQISVPPMQNFLHTFASKWFINIYIFIKIF